MTEKSGYLNDTELGDIMFKLKKWYNDRYGHVGLIALIGGVFVILMIALILLIIKYIIH
jgi:hypothetical protein